MGYADLLLASALLWGLLGKGCHCAVPCLLAHAMPSLKEMPGRQSNRSNSLHAVRHSKPGLQKPADDDALYRRAEAPAES